MLSCDVFGYIGDLRPAFAAVRELLRGSEDGAAFAFSAETPLFADPIDEQLCEAALSRDDDCEQTEQSTRDYELQGTGR